MASVTRGTNFKAIPLDIVGSSRFGRYAKIDAEHTFNMYITEDGPQPFLVNYSGYKIGIDSIFFENSTVGRGMYVSTKLNRIYVIFDTNVFEVNLTFDQLNGKIEYFDIAKIGELITSTGQVFVAENNKPQLLFSDGVRLYVYDPTLTTFTVACTLTVTTDLVSYTGERNLTAGEPITFGSTAGGVTAGVRYFVSTEGLDMTSSPKVFKITTNITDAYLGIGAVTLSNAANTFTTEGTFQRPPLSFRPGHISFHDTYGLATASDDTYYDPAANNTYRLSAENNFLMWPDDATTIGALETKPDNTRAILRFPSGGNLIMVMGENVSEDWFDVGDQLFPYQRNNQSNIDYGCVSPNSVASLNNIVVWLAQNEKSGPIIMYSTGGLPETISTDGISFRLSNLQFPEDCTAFIFRQYGHTIYHINFHSDNFSLFYDFSTQKFFEACDQNMNYYHISSIGFFNNQYFGISKDSGDFYIVDAQITYFQKANDAGIDTFYEMPRIRTTSNVRLGSQDYFIVNDVGFTIESGETNYWPYTVTTSPSDPYTLVTLQEDGEVPPQPFVLVTESGDTLVTDQMDPDSSESTTYNLVPKVGLSISRNGGASFGSFYDKELPPIGERRNRLLWWQGGICNDLVCKIRFLGYGRIAATDGVINIRQ